MEIKSNIIAIRNRNIREANEAFDDFMKKTEQCINERSAKDPKSYKQFSPSELENVAVCILKDVCPSTPFHPDDIKLVSGINFPDILATDYYGVEVKSTNKNKWTSTGSSIVETTRSKHVERIYMLFGNLGSAPPSFKCRPYQECLSGIAVTHAPRYLINMELGEGYDILSKMEKNYDDFRKLDEKDKISQVRAYYIQQAKLEKKVEIPWWMGENDESDRKLGVTLSIFSDQESRVKDELTMRAFILFSSIYDKDSSVRYKQIALWLCNKYSFICHNMRDSFSAGGMVREIDGVRLKKPLPKVVGSLLKYKDDIKYLLNHPDMDIIEDIEDYWGPNHDKNNYYSLWVDMVERAFGENPELKDVDIRKYLM